MARIAFLLLVMASVAARAEDRVTVRYAADDPVKNAMEIFRPTGAVNAPVVMFFHGGVWQLGDMRQYRNVGEAFSSQGIVTAVVNYRLTPSVKHPAHVEDAARAVAWMVAHAREHGGDPSRIFLVGHSAGGQLVTLLLMDPSWLKAHGVDAERIAGVVPLSGVFDLASPISDDGDGGFADFIHPPFGKNPRVLEAASPTRRVRATKVPLLVILAGEDSVRMREQSAQFVAACRKQGLKLGFETVPRVGHFELVARIGSEGDRTTALVTSFVKRGGP